MARSYAPIQTFEAKQLSVNLLDTPENFYGHNRRYSASTILNITYGRRIPECKFPHIFANLKGTARKFAKSILFSSAFPMYVVLERI
jgi:hypothetical protein